MWLMLMRDSKSWAGLANEPYQKRAAQQQDS
jgi:hypothetical protein